MELFYGIIPRSAAREAHQQFSIRIASRATFCWKTLIRWYQDALWEHINAIKANSRSQTSAWPPCLLPSWLPLWDSWAPALQPAAHLIFLYSIVVPFILHFPPTFPSLYFISSVVTTLKNPPLPIRTSGVKSKCKSLNENNTYYHLNEF